MQNLVIDIGDVTDKCDVVSALDKPATQNIEVHARTDMTNMRWSLNSGTAEIDADFALIYRCKWGGGSRQGVVKM
jgi:hypothetical protein